MIMPTASHPAIRRVRRQGLQPSIHGNKLWKSSCLLLDYLGKHTPEHHDRVLDVGCGWGIAGLWCAARLGAEVTSMDADPDVFPYLDAVAALNGVRSRHLVKRFEQLTTRELAQYDLLIAADICFWDDMVKPVTNLVNRAVKAGVKHIVIADPERSTFLEMAQICVDRHYAELLPWRCRGSVQARGALMVIENA
ncbi:MAG: methyltransferase domain-containing protein [Haliea sp.]|uniref:class I SAM-dependent methyltransferase n=1 Tax=Haliea sp. TaxID=1932666 RepID=UPI0032EF1411